MSKKKRFAGKKTKLAKHALTQVLEQVHSEASPPAEARLNTLAQAVQTLRQDQLPLQFSLPPDISLDQRLPMTSQNWYATLLNDLHNLRELLRSPGVPPRRQRLGTEPVAMPESGIVNYAMGVIAHTLKEIRALLD